MPPEPQPEPSSVPDPLERQHDRSAFYENLPPEAKERFLEVATDARERGLSDEAAWEEAVIAVERTYPPDHDREEEVVLDEAPSAEP